MIRKGRVNKDYIGFVRERGDGKKKTFLNVSQSRSPSSGHKTESVCLRTVRM